MKRLLFVVNHSGFFLTHRLPIARAAHAQGWEVHVASPQDEHAPGIPPTGFQHHPIPLTRSGMRPGAELRLFLSMIALLRRLRPSLLHLVSIKPVLYGGLAARLTGVPAVVSAVSGLGHMFVGEELGVRLVRGVAVRTYRTALRHPNMRAVFQNPDDRDLFERLGLVDPARSVLVRSSGVDLEEFRPRPEPGGELVAMMPARLLSTKGVHEFVEAARLLAGRGKPWRFVLVGGRDPGNPATVSERQVRDWVDAGTVEWWGHRTDMPAILPQAHVICLPSYREGFPKVLLEAAACGRAIIATDVPGCREAVDHGSTGLLVPARDPSALAEAIAHLLDNAALRRRMGEAGRVRVESAYSVEHVATAHLDIYAQLT